MRADRRLFVLLFLFSLCPAFAASAAEADLTDWLLPEPSFPNHNPYSTAKAELGRLIFFDPRLSPGKNLSCLNCHNPGLAWADGLPRSRVSGLHSMPRHTPSLINVAYRDNFFWDGRTSSLEAAVSEHLQGIYIDIDGMLATLRGMPGYRQRFADAFGTQDISLPEVAAALATFLRTIVQRNTPFDQWAAGDPDALSAAARRGFALFTGKAGCIACHAPPAFSDGKFHRSRLNSIDPGRYEITHMPGDRNAFRTPDLRQAALSAPYMHAGQKPTLISVIRYYNAGGSSTDIPLHLSGRDMHDLEAFLKSLSGPMPQAAIPQLPVP